MTLERELQDLLDNAVLDTMLALRARATGVEIDVRDASSVELRDYVARVSASQREAFLRIARKLDALGT